MTNATGKSMSLNRLRLFGLLPTWITIGVLMIGPLLIMAAVSLMEANVYGGVHLRFDVSSYVQILFDKNLFDETEFNPAYLIIILRSFMLALGATILALLIGFPAAYYIARQPDHRKNLLVFLITIPFWTNLLVRTFAWVIILGRGGFMDQVGSFLNIIGPDESINLMYTNTAILIGLVYSYLPLMVLPLYSSMEKMDVRLLEAGADLYANRFELIRRIILPLTMPGIIGGSILVFVPCLGAFIAPDLLGGGKKLMLGSLVQLQFATSRNWPFGAAIAMMLLAIVVIALMLNARAARRHAAYEQGGAEVTHG
ncbi:MAG: ABC transporter permease [Alphaproteobacteria bacterium]|jgi:spermidine/putrescine transport system permease protein